MLTSPSPSLLLLGGGYVLSHLANNLSAEQGTQRSFVITSRQATKVNNFRAREWLAEQLDLSDQAALERVWHKYPKISAVIDSVPPIGTAELARVNKIIELGEARKLQHLIYLSTTGVYGAVDGSELTEESPSNPLTETGKRRLEVEQRYRLANFSTTILRLSGIYGPGREISERIRSGRMRIPKGIVRYSNRIHLLDILGVLEILIHAPPTSGTTHRVFNLSDNEPAPISEVARYYCDKFGMPYPDEIDPKDIPQDSRLIQNGRVSNRKIREELGYIFRVGSFRDEGSNNPT